MISAVRLIGPVVYAVVCLVLKGSGRPMIRLAETMPCFAAGELVRHRRYGYRGVIVSVDARCMATSDWYDGNRTQPDQNQPWYHVLVDGSGQTTYVAESNLTPDPSGDPVDHPLLKQFFDGPCQEGYRRNGQPWPGW